MQVLSQITDAVIVFGFDNCVLYWNRGAELLYGRSPDAMLGRPLSLSHRNKWLHGEQDQTVQESVRQNGHWSGQLLHILHDGRRLSWNCE